jgi:hypothetical protein
MCTVAFVPRPESGYVLGHNRDEARARTRGVPPERYTQGGRLVLAPRDPDGGGTWIGVHDGAVSACILNATEIDPHRLPVEPESRGRILVELLHLDGADTIGAHLEGIKVRLGGVRAFHLVVAEPPHEERPARSVRFRWDGSCLTRDDHDGPRLYVSSSLNQTGAEQARDASWRRLLETSPEPDGNTLQKWLASHEPQRGPLSVCMHRPEAKTVSRTLVSVAPGVVEMGYLSGAPCSPEADEIFQRL